MGRSPNSPKIRVELTQEIIDAGIPRDSKHCMFAEALRVARPDFKAISVDLATVRCTNSKKGLRYTYLTPRIWQVQLVNFDQGRKPEPFSCVLRGAHVTRSGNTKPPKLMTEKEKRQRTASGLRLNQQLKKTKIVERYKDKGAVPDRVGGQAPPLQINGDGVPFTRRRAFGLRGLEY